MQKKDSFRRRRPYLNKRKILIVCCGETEKAYFKRFAGEFCENGLCEIEVSTKGNDAKSVTMFAENSAMSNEYLSIWAVFDYDEDSCFNEIIRNSKNNDVTYIFSNMAFEFWFLLHFRYTTKDFKNADLTKELSKHLKFQYDKSQNTRKHLDILFSEEHKSRINEVIENSEKAYCYHKENSGNKHSDWCSCTNVHKLIKKLLDISE